MPVDTNRYPSITLSDVDELIVTARLEAATKYEVFRVRNSEVLGTFTDNVGAQTFIDEQDYDTSRVMVRPVNLPVPSDADYLEAFRREALRDCPSFAAGAELIRADLVTAEYARSRAHDLFSDVDLSAWPWKLINWSQAARDLKSAAELKVAYATLRDARYYDFTGL